MLLKKAFRKSVDCKFFTSKHPAGRARLVDTTHRSTESLSSKEEHNPRIDSIRGRQAAGRRRQAGIDPTVAIIVSRPRHCSGDGRPGGDPDHGTP
jgi:hypothetical protein